MISEFSFSLRRGLFGSALDYVVSKIVVFFVAAFAFYYVVKAKPEARFDKNETKAILRIGKYTGLESAVRNAGYILGMLIVLNTLGTEEYGGYGVAMTIMWLIFLIPILALGEATNVAIGNEYGNRNLEGMKRVHLVSTILMGSYMGVAMIAGVFAWERLSFFFNDSENIVHYSVATFNYLAIPYLFFALGTALRSLFIGTGKTLYYLVPSAVVNLCVYIPLGLMVKSGAYVPSFGAVMTISFAVFATDLVIVSVLVMWVYKRLSTEMSGTGAAA
jgi:Na+-driven multidrug efflux pump